MKNAQGLNNKNLKLLAIPVVFIIVYLLFILSNYDSTPGNPGLVFPTPVSDVKQAKAIIFEDHWCKDCTKAKWILAKHQVPFYVYQINKSKEAEKKYIELSGYQVPLILIGKQRLDGYDERKLVQAIRQLKSNPAP